MDSPCILAVDLGTSGCKTALVTLEGRVADWAFAQVPLHILPGGGAEQVPADWWTALVATTRKVMAHGGIPPDAVAAVCCSCQGEGTVPVDRDGRALMNAITWADMRGASRIRARARGWPSLAGYGAWRLARWLRITGGAPALTGSDPSAHMLLVREAFRVLVLTQRPGKVKLDLPVDLPRPRKDDIRYTPHFGKLARKLRGTIE